ncbi:universal stress protein [Massilia sp. S19_KUP03_FR1]|uniref:universal stress protein n=1 Tax=Massilia sp. S19_KUP03_FR1 TaxID=3025503 RepID=UPI002FCDAA5A
MFQRILLPVDGSLSMVPLVRKGLAFAAGIGAHVVVLHVVPVAARALDAAADARADPAQILADVTAQATLLGVSCEGKLLAGAEPWRAILQAAGEGDIDLICMGSHGRHGATEHVLASQTARVLEHTQLPVLLFR